MRFSLAWMARILSGPIYYCQRGAERSSQIGQVVSLAVRLRMLKHKCLFTTLQYADPESIDG
jgi:hypothetical protein